MKGSMPSGSGERTTCARASASGGRLSPRATDSPRPAARPATITARTRPHDSIARRVYFLDSAGAVGSRLPTMRKALIGLLSVAAITVPGCKYFGWLGIKDPDAKNAAAKLPQPKPQPTVRSFTDTQAATTIAGAGGVVWEGTARGLL